MSYLREKFEEWAAKERYWPLLLLGMIPALLPVIQNYFSITFREAVEHWLYSILTGVIFIVSGILICILGLGIETRQERRDRAKKKISRWRLVYKNPRRFGLSVILSILGLYIFVEGIAKYLPNPLPNDKLVITILRFSTVSPAATDDGNNVPHRIEQILLERQRSGAPIEVKRLPINVEGSNEEERMNAAKLIGLSKKGFAHIVIWGEVRKDENELYVKPYIAISHQLLKNQIEDPNQLLKYQIEVNRPSDSSSLDQSNLKFKEQLANDLSDLTLFVYGLAYFKTQNWDKTIEILSHVDSDEGKLYTGIAHQERSRTSKNPRTDLESAIEYYEKVCLCENPGPNSPPRILTYTSVHSYYVLAAAYSELASISDPQESITYLRKAVKFNQLVNTLYGPMNDTNTQAWLAVQNSLARDLRGLGASLDGEEGRDLIKESIKVFDAALKVAINTEGRSYETILEIGKVSSLLELSEKVYGEEGTTALRDAVNISKSVLDAIPKTPKSRERMIAEHQLGRSLRLLGDRIGGAGVSGLFYFRDKAKDSNALGLLQEALAAERDALSNISLVEQPNDWAIVENEIGLILGGIGDIYQFQGRVYFDSAIKSHEAVLKVITKETNPQEWARTHIYLSNHLTLLAQYVPATEAVEFFEKAIESRQEALQVYKRESTPTAWATLQIEIGDIQNRLSIEFSDDPLGVNKSIETLRIAIEENTNALSVYDRVRSPKEWATIQAELGESRSLLGKKIPGEEGNKLIRQGLEDIKNAQTIYTKEKYPREWCASENQLLEAQKALWFRGDKVNSKWSGISIILCN